MKSPYPQARLETINDWNIKQQMYERFKLYCSLRVKLAVD